MPALLEFCVPGPPVSARSRDRGRLESWRDRVRAAAGPLTDRFPLPPHELLVVEVTHYFLYRYRGDGDNLLKPILDSLIDAVYHDDRQIRDIVWRRRDLGGRFHVVGMSAILTESLRAGRDFVHVVVRPYEFEES